MHERRRALVAVAAVLFAGATLGAASAATAVGPTASVRALPATRPLNYASEPGRRLRQLDPEFVASQLGLPPAGQLARSLSGVAPPARDGPVPGGRSLAGSPRYACVNGHQTSDPLSPPCVASFTGGNGGATYPGVSKADVTVLFTIGVGEDFNVTRRRRWGGYYDMDRPPTDDESATLPELSRLRLYQTYFNRHYATWGRRVHFVVYSYNQAYTDRTRSCRSVALENYAIVHPFGVLINNALPDCYSATLAGLGVPTFDAIRQAEPAAYRRHPAMRWGFWPDTRAARRLFSSYICQKVVHRPVVLSGNLGENGRPRRIGVIQTAQPGDSLAFPKAVTADIKRCGGDVVATAELIQPAKCATALFTPFDDVIRLMKDFRDKGVTTVVWPGCDDERVAPAAAFLRWYPEWVLWGSGNLDQAFPASYSSLFGSPALDEWTKHAVVVTPSTFQPFITDHRLCFDALREIDPSVDTSDTTWAACNWYDNLRQFFSAMQLAGPRLTPAAMDSGVRTFSVTSSSPQVPRCSYSPGDYTCVKDAQVDWWDGLRGKSQPAGGVGPTGAQTGGCWRAMEQGRRYEAGQWPPGNIDAQMQYTLLDSSDPCSYQGSYPVP